MSAPKDRHGRNKKSPQKSERKMLKTILLGCLHQLFCEMFEKQLRVNQNQSSWESYAVDSRIMQLMIDNIVETGEYTPEGIAYYARIPLDVIYDALSFDNKHHLSVTAWARIANLFLQVKPEAAKLLMEKLIEMKNKNTSSFSDLLTEE